MARQLKLLCLDGGGVRGLSSLYLLKQLMEAIDRKNPPRPCDFFDMMGGTSTGGLIAIMLGRLEMTIDECIRCYFDIMDKVFQKTQHRINIRTGNFQGRYDTVELEKCIKDIIRGRTINGRRLKSSELFRVKGDHGCKVFVCAVNVMTNNAEQLTSYEREFESKSDFHGIVKVWEAARATSAATSFFDPITIGKAEMKQTFVDGATAANNPVRKLWQEAQGQWGTQLEPQIQCLVSVGTGIPKMKSFGKGPAEVIQTLKKIATETEDTAVEFQSEHEDLRQRYFRLNVTHGLEDVRLDDAMKKRLIIAATGRHGDLPEFKDALRRFRAAVASFIAEYAERNLQEMNFENGASEPTSEIPVQPQKRQVLEEVEEKRSQASLPLLENHPSFFKQPAQHFWDHLTEASLQRYERIYQEICDGKDRYVSYRDIVNFLYERPLDLFLGWEEALMQNWKLILLAPLDHGLPRNLTMALLYTFHVWRFSPDEFASLEPIYDDSPTHKALRSFGNWVTCSCGCGRRWNFANGMHGLRDDRRRRRPCLPGTWKDDEHLDSVREELSQAPSLLKSNFHMWCKKQEHSVSL